MNENRYDSTTRALHWLIAVLVVATYAVGIVREELPKGDFRTLLLTLHMSVGISIVALTIVRIFNRLTHAALAPVLMPPMMQLASKAGHGVLYLALFAIPLIGLFAAWAKGRPLTFFGLFPVPSPIAVNRDFAKTLEGAHEVAAHIMMLLAFGHAVVAIYHQKVLKDGTLGRMMTRFSPLPEPR